MRALLARKDPGNHGDAEDTEPHGGGAIVRSRWGTSFSLRERTSIGRQDDSCPHFSGSPQGMSGLAVLISKGIERRERMRNCCGPLAGERSSWIPYEGPSSAARRTSWSSTSWFSWRRLSNAILSPRATEAISSSWRLVERSPVHVENVVIGAVVVQVCALS
jgi:hypothetical protein